jgi:hypothetical protein
VVSLQYYRDSSQFVRLFGTAELAVVSSRHGTPPQSRRIGNTRRPLSRIMLRDVILPLYDECQRVRFAGEDRRRLEELGAYPRRVSDFV